MEFEINWIKPSAEAAAINGTHWDGRSRYRDGRSSEGFRFQLSLPQHAAALK